jgi:hypothetical protein
VKNKLTIWSRSPIIDPKVKFLSNYIHDLVAGQYYRQGYRDKEEALDYVSTQSESDASR